LDDAKPNVLIALPTPKYSILLGDLFETASVPPMVVRYDRTGELFGGQVLLTSAAVRRLGIQPSRSFTSEGSLPRSAYKPVRDISIGLPLWWIFDKFPA